MATKRYKLTPRGDVFDNDGMFGFRLRFGEDAGQGRTRVRRLRACPLIRIPKGGTIQIANETAQFFIEQMQVPTNTKRNGKRRDAGPMFIEVPSAGPPADLDFEALLFAKGTPRS